MTAETATRETRARVPLVPASYVVLTREHDGRT